VARRISTITAAAHRAGDAVAHGHGTWGIVRSMRAEDLILWETGIRGSHPLPRPQSHPPACPARPYQTTSTLPISGRVLPETLAGQLTVKLQVYSYIAFTAGRYPQSVVEITGLSAPTFTGS
jgi:hypothetical protein